MSAYGLGTARSNTRGPDWLSDGVLIPAGLFFTPSLRAGAYLGCNRGIKFRTIERNGLMKTLQSEKKFHPLGSYELGGVMLFALFGMPLAMHLLARFLQ